MAWINQGIVNDGETGKNPPGVKDTAQMKPERQADGAKNPDGVANAAPMKKPKAAVRKKAKHAMRRGLVSEKAAKKHLGGY